MSDPIVEELRRRVAGDDEQEIETAFAEVDLKLRSLVELIDFAHDARVTELEQEAANTAASPLHSVR